MNGVTLTKRSAERLALAAADEAVRSAVVGLAIGDAAVVADAQNVMDIASATYREATGKRLPHGRDADGLPAREILWRAIETGELPARAEIPGE